MSTDRELLELAAKAAGISGGWGEKIDCGTGLVDLTDYWLLDGEEMIFWNPITDDGDALRLAVNLDIPISPESCNGTVWVCRGDLQIFEALGVDSNAAVRRAIVRAAAEIGRRMP